MSTIQGETLAQFLDRREKELQARVSALRGQLTPLEAELAQVQKIKNLIRDLRAAGVTDHASNALLTPSPNLLTGHAAVDLGLVTDIYEKMTIKELVIQALIDHFPAGATVTDVRNFIGSAYARSLDAGSMRAQMHRLKADQILTQEGEIWNLLPQKRTLYRMYDHPSSRANMRELQDEPPEGSARRTIAGGAGLDD